MNNKNKTGILYIVGTPLGNLEDISLRALKTLSNVSLILCEDTRKTRNLLSHFNLKNKLESYHKYTEKRKIPHILAKLKEGEDVALVSNAGMPLISDPGNLLVESAAAKNIKTVPIPGPTALVTALAVSGLDTSAFTFCGFLPKKNKEKKEILSSLLYEPRTLIFYESPHRLIITLTMLAEIFKDREIVVARELTKIFEEVIKTKAPDIVHLLKERQVVLKGEFVLLIEGYKEELKDISFSARDLKKYVQEARQSLKVSKKEAIAWVAARYKVPKKVVYKSSLT